MHPVTPMDALPVPRSLAESGVHVLCGRTRYFKNDAALIFEKTLLDFGAWIRHAKEELGYEKVVLGGWSGGGSLSMLYQSQAENPTIVDTPYGDPVDVVGAGLIPADAWSSRPPTPPGRGCCWSPSTPRCATSSTPRTATRLDLYRPENLASRPYSADFVAEYRAAQLSRMRRITATCVERLEMLENRGGKEIEGAFVVHRTAGRPALARPDPGAQRPSAGAGVTPAIPRRSTPGRSASRGSARCARGCRSGHRRHPRQGRGVCQGRHGAVPRHREQRRRRCAPAAHVHEVFEAVASTDKEYKVVKGADHYYAGTPELLKQTTELTLEFVAKRGLLDLSPPSPTRLR